MRALATSVTLLAVVACAHGPTTKLTPRDASPVSASFESTWRATIAVFAERNIPIATIDKTSGLIATTTLGIDAPKDTVLFWADCGATTGIGAVEWAATQATCNVLVRGGVPPARRSRSR